jgi:excisionase family DNA binding protein
MPETHDALELLTTREAAAIARVDVSTVNKWVRQGNLPTVQREPRTLIDREDFERFLQQRKPPIPETHDALELLTTREAAAIARVDMSTVHKWVRRGILPAVQRKPYLLIDREDLERFLQQRKPPTQATSPEPEAATGTAPYDDQPGELAQGRSAEADEERQGAEEVQDPARLLTRKEAAAVAGIHQSTMGRWARTKKVQTTPNGLIPSSELQRLGYLGSDDTHREEQLELIAVAPHPAPAVSSRPSDSIALLLQERDALRRERDYLLRALDDARDREHRQTALLQGELNAARDRELRLLRLLEAERLQTPTGHRLNPREDTLPSPTPTPFPQSLSARVLEYLEAQQRPRYAGEVQQALGLSASPARTLRGLVNRGKARRLKPGLYAAISVPGYIPPGCVQEPAPDTRVGRVLAYVRNATQAGRGVLGWQIQEALGLPERPHRELSKLHAWGFILRVRPGVYLARRPADGTQASSDDGAS